MIKIPVVSVPEQLFSISIYNETYDLRVTWNDRSAQWSMGIAQDDTVLIDNIVLVCGVNAVEQYNFSFNNLFIFNNEDFIQDPIYEDFGTASVIVIMEPAEYEEWLISTAETTN